VRVILVLAATAAITLGIIWVAGRLNGPAPAPTPAQAAASAKVDRNYRRLVRRLRVRGRQVQRIRAARKVWARHADGICRTIVRGAANSTATLTHAKTPSEAFALLSNLLTIETNGVQRLHALPAPWYDAAKIRKLLDLFDQGVADDRALFSALRRNDGATVRRLTRHEARLGERATPIAAGLGADICADDTIWDETS
jgi:hypothetical protein